MAKNSNAGNWLYTLGRALLFCLCCAVALAAIAGITKALPMQWGQHLLLVVAIIITFGLTLLFTRWQKLRPGDIGIVPASQSVQRICIGFAIGLAMALLQPLLVLTFGHVKLVASPTLTATVVILNLALYLLVAVREELAFRAYPLRSLNYALGPWKAQLIVAAIFALEHVIGGVSWLHAIFGAGTGAIFFGLAALRTKGLALPIGLHAAWNFGQWCVGFKNEPGIWRAVIEKGYENRFDNINSICYILVMGLAIAAFYLFYKGKSRA